MQSHVEEAEHIQNLLNQGQAEQALQNTKQLLAQKPDDPVLRSVCSGILIDCGTPGFLTSQSKNINIVAK